MCVENVKAIMFTMCTIVQPPLLSNVRGVRWCVHALLLPRTFAMVVEREQHGWKRKVKEALHIHRMTRKDGSMNQDRGLHLSKIWLDLVQ